MKMEMQTLNKHDFKKYLLLKLPDSRQEDLIFWKKGIPLPIDLVYKIFDKRGELLKIYLDHLSSIALYSYSAKVEDSDHDLKINNLPSVEMKNNIQKLSEQYYKYYLKSKVSDFINLLAEKLYVVEYNFTQSNYITAICHEGRKYKRLYLPLNIKERLEVYDSELLKIAGVSNGDMFGNIVADELGVYRSGFSDAFAAIFNKLLDFILEKSSGKAFGKSSASNIRISQVADSEISYSNINTGKIIDGSLWEPKYLNARSSYIVNEKHPYYEIINKKSAVEVLIDFTSQSALIENEAVKDINSQILETYRQELSKRLRLIAEELH